MVSYHWLFTHGYGPGVVPMDFCDPLRCYVRVPKGPRGRKLRRILRRNK